MMLAVIKTGGKQYLVKAGNKIRVEKLAGQAGQAIEFATLLKAGNEQGEKLEIGKPLLVSKTEGKILKQDKAKKVLVVKYKPKTRYRKRVGHRQPFTEVLI